MPIKNLFERFKETYRGLNEPEYMDVFAGFYWHALVLTGALIVLFSLFYGAQTFMGVQETIASEANLPSASVKDLDKDQLQAALDGFKARSARFNATVSATPTIPDPAK